VSPPRKSRRPTDRRATTGSYVSAETSPKKRRGLPRVTNSKQRREHRNILAGVTKVVTHVPRVIKVAKEQKPWTEKQKWQAAVKRRLAAQRPRAKL
jgi:ribosome-binding protein aMBF1 (putative translation factor)